MKLDREDGLEGGVELWKIICGMIIALLIVSVFPLVFNIQLVKALGETIYIKADGSVDPPSAPILNVGNVYYTFTDDIIYDFLVVERDNIVVDGAGHVLEGTGTGNGISLTGRSNVTIKSITIIFFYYGIYLSSSSGNTLSENNITNNDNCGIYLYGSSNNSITGNVFTNGGLYVSYSYGNVVEGNVVNGKPLVYLEGVSDHTVNEAGQVIVVNCTGIRVENLNLSNTYVGVLLWNTTNSKITVNNITNNVQGIRLFYSLNNSIIANNITANNDIGIELDGSSNNSISANNITANTDHGIELAGSNNNSITANNITANNGYGIVLFESSNNSITANNIANNFQGIVLYESLNNSITSNNIVNNGYGILLDDSSNNSITANNIANNDDYGIKLLYYSSNNSITSNSIANNECGIWLYGSSKKNRIYHNNFINNTEQVDVLYSYYANVWDDGYPSGGNYWSDYTGVDDDGDGIGDTPYVIDADNIDYYPLMKPWAPVTNVASLVVRGQNNLIYYRTYNATTDSWTSWNALPGATCDSPAAAACGNELHIVVRGYPDNNTLYHGYINLATSAFSGWTKLSGSTPSTPTLTG